MLDFGVTSSFQVTEAYTVIPNAAWNAVPGLVRAPPRSAARRPGFLLPFLHESLYRRSQWSAVLTACAVHTGIFIESLWLLTPLFLKKYLCREKIT